jgi:GTP-binding protein
VPIPRIAIVGRPNVGKSSLLNMIAGAKVSIVDATPGTTRDRVSAILDLDPPIREGGPVKPVEIIDTGGYGAYEAPGERYNEIGVDLAPLRAQIESQIALAVSSSDLILFCVDAQAGVTPLDQEVARLLREGKLPGSGPRAPRPKLPPIQIVATKVDGPKWEAHGLEIAALGLGEPWLVSSTSNYMRRDLLDGLYERLPAPVPEDVPPQADLRVAIIGKRNAGKSSLVNALAGEERVIVSEIAGTTRDAVDVRIEHDGRSILLIDTAGLRRKKSFANQIEWWAFDRAKRSIDRADVVLLLVDATEPTSQVDEQLAMLCQKTYKPVAIIVNKWDLAEGGTNERGEAATPQVYEEYLRRELKGISYAPIAFISAATGLNLQATIDLAFDLHKQASERVGTGKLNRLVREILERHNPPSKLGTFAKVFYVSQVRADPPTIVLVVNKPELFTANYQKFLVNRFREELPFPEVPIKLLVRGRKPQKGGGIDLSLEDRAFEASEAAEVEAEAIAAASAPEEDLDADAYFEDDEE